MKESEKQMYWELVGFCLQTFCPETENPQEQAQKHREHMETLLAGSEAADILYHEHPYYMAKRLAGSNEEMSEQDQAIYNELEEKYLDDNIC